MTVSLIIPAYNEQHRLPATLIAYGEALRGRYGEDYEVVVVANGCKDDTVRVSEELAGSISNLKVIDVRRPVGKGGAIIEGFKHVGGESIVFADADGATAPGSLVELADGLYAYDMIAGSRRAAGSAITQPQPPARRAFGLGFSLASRALFGLKFSDTQCGAKAFRREAALALAEEVVERRWTFDLDLILTAHRLGLKVREHPVRWADRDGSKLPFAPTAWEVSRALVSMKLRYTQPEAGAIGEPRAPLSEQGAPTPTARSSAEASRKLERV